MRSSFLPKCQPKIDFNMYRGATAGKAPKAWALPRFWVSIRSYKKQPVKQIWGRIFAPEFAYLLVSYISVLQTLKLNVQKRFNETRYAYVFVFHSSLHKY